MSEQFDRIAPLWLDKLEKELKPELQYHSINHVLTVIERVEFIGSYEGLAPNDVALVKIAALFHDSGFLISPTNHEASSCAIVRDTLPDYGFAEADIEHICELIMATKIPQSPKTLLENIIADADLEYLGTDLFEKIGKTLFEELKHFNPDFTEHAWDELQLVFMQKHHYHTEYCQKHREPKKQENLLKVKKRLGLV